MRWNLCDRVKKFMHGYDTQPDYDKFWKERDYLRLAHRVKVPVLVAHGLLDFNVKTWEGTAWYERVRTQKAMVLGQWPHSSPRLHYPAWDRLLLQWLDRWLYGIRNGIEHKPGVHVQTNDGKWQVRDSWGPKRKLRLRMQGPPKIFEYFDDGALTETEMVRGPSNGRSLRLRVKNSSGLHIEGRPVLHMVAASDSPSTHFVAVLCDVAPNGSCDVISRAFFNARYRNSLEKGKDLKPNKKYVLSLQFIDKSHKIAKDHHLEIRVASSSTTWVVSDERRATNTLFPTGFWLELPVR
jgi:X-Pro dipeptidyl-peptidase